MSDVIDQAILVEFKSKYVLSESKFYNGTPCWEWTGATSSGYGTMRRRIYGHRLSYNIHKGQIPDGLQIDHLCRVRHCVNPEHLEAVTQKENILRGTSPVVDQIKRTHCPRGHALSGSNLTVSGGKRYCKTCGRNKNRERYYANRDRINADRRSKYLSKKASQ